jgi:hypothetical protein
MWHEVECSVGWQREEIDGVEGLNRDMGIWDGTELLDGWPASGSRLAEVVKQKPDKGNDCTSFIDEMMRNGSEIIDARIGEPLKVGRETENTNEKAQRWREVTTNDSKCRKNKAAKPYLNGVLERNEMK